VAPRPIVNELNIPLVFTPNGDGFTDYFEITGLEAYPNHELIVFNRWERQVYQATEYRNDWKGTGPSGEPLPDGTYYYIFKLDRTNPKAEVMAGYTTILR
jgi:gliding motility-associated-like protein